MHGSISNQKVFTKKQNPEPEFYYCTIQDLRDEGVPAPAEDPEEFVQGAVSDKRLQRLILNASNIMNIVTNQFFQPWCTPKRTDGSGSDILYTHYQDKIYKIHNIYRIDLSGSGYGHHINTTSHAIDLSSFSPHFHIIHDIGIVDHSIVYGHSYYVQNERYAAMNFADRGELYVKRPKFDDDSAHHVLEFARGNNNWVIDGVFGDFKPLEEIELDLAFEVNRGDTTLFLSSTEDINIGDCLSICPYNFIVNDIIDESKVSIDPSLVKIKLTSPRQKVYRYGKIHSDIREAAMRLVISRLYGANAISDTYGDIIVPGSSSDHYRRLIFEKTDNYQYQYGKNNSAQDRQSNSLQNGGTGDEYVDSILRRHTAPLYAGYV